MDLDDFPIPTSQRSARTAVIAYTAAFTSGMPFQVGWVGWGGGQQGVFVAGVMGGCQVWGVGWGGVGWGGVGSG